VLKASESGIHAADLFHMATIATGCEPVQLPSSSNSSFSLKFKICYSWPPLTGGPQ